MPGPTVTGTTNKACEVSPTTGTDAEVDDEPPYADPHQRWCGRAGANPALPDQS